MSAVALELDGFLVSDAVPLPVKIITGKVRTPKILAEGQLSATAQTVYYTVPASTVVRDIQILASSTNGNQKTKFFLKKSGAVASRLIGAQTLAFEGASLEIRLTGLGAGDTIEATVQNINKVDFVITGEEEA
jgi:hypothetical protein